MAKMLARRELLFKRGGEMRVDVLLEQFRIMKSGSSKGSCSGLVLVNWLPPGEVQAANPAGRKVMLSDSEPVNFNGFQEQFELRATVTGKSWLEVQIISATNFGLLGKLIAEIIDFAKGKWPLPLGSSLLDAIADDVKDGALQVIAVGRSQVFPADSIPKRIDIELQASADVVGWSEPTEPITGTARDGGSDREVLLEKGEPNGSVTLCIEPA